MYRKILQQSLAIDADNSTKKFEVEYYLVETEDHNLVLNEISDRSYGIEIVKKFEAETLDDSGLYIHESELVTDFSPCKKKTSELIDKLAKNTVTPSSLRYIIDDILGE